MAERAGGRPALKPSVVLLGFVLGSAAAITFGLSGVLLVFAVLRPDYPRLQEEFPSLLQNLGVFAVLTAAAGVSFYGLLFQAAWRRIAVAVLLAGLAAAVWFYWPS
jgi:cobalamin synthase